MKWESTTLGVPGKLLELYQQVKDRDHKILDLETQLMEKSRIIVDLEVCSLHLNCRKCTKENDSYISVGIHFVANRTTSVNVRRH